VDDDRPDPAFSHPPEHSLQHWSVGGACGLPGVPPRRCPWLYEETPMSQR
jgi:hypothetical protein